MRSGLQLGSRARKRTVVTAGVLVTAGFVAYGATGVAAAYQPRSHGSEINAVVTGSVHVFPRNFRGSTYGSELNASNPASAPDLIAAYATNGRLGYVRKNDLRPQAPKTPALALREQATATDAKTRVIPVYAVDGSTVIGSYNIGSSSR